MSEEKQYFPVDPSPPGQAVQEMAQETGIPASILEATYAAGYRDAQLTMQTAPELYTRIHLEKNSKGWNSESTITVRGVAMTTEEVMAQARELLQATDAEIRQEIARREKLDQDYKAGPVGRLEIGGSGSGK